jgi:PAS domain S-box-containing protein
LPESPYDRRKVALIFLLVLVPALFFLGWSQASLNLSFIRPQSPEQTLLLLSLSAVIFLAFVIFALILLRILLKLYVERRQQRLGSRFKTTMVVAFLALSLVPVCFLFAFAYGLLNRTIDRWFSIPLDLISADSGEIVRQLQSHTQSRSSQIARHLAGSEALLHAVAASDQEGVLGALEHEVVDLNLESAMCFDRQGRLLAEAGDPIPGPSEVVRMYPQLSQGRLSAGGLSDNWRSGGFEMFVSAQPLRDPAGGVVGTAVAVTRLPLKLLSLSQEIQREAQKYAQLTGVRRALKRTYLSFLCLITLVILFIATWFALFLSKQVTVPIQALAEATQEVAKGNLGYQVSVRADDELGTLIQSFNSMTRQLQENRLAIDQAAKELQAVNRQLEERGNTIEAILENIPTGVISFDPQDQITSVNTMAKRLFGREEMGALHTLSDLFTPEDTRDVARLFRRAARQGVASRQMELDLGGRRAFTSLTVSSVRTRHGKIGSVLVLEDLSELVQAQKAAAWQEVAQRVAHEIKNPLTPIQLSTERITRLIERAGALPPDLLRVVSESAALVGREVTSLKSLVDEFAAFARFPASKPLPSSLNEIVENALKIFDGRLRGIEIHRDLSPDLPLAVVDPEQLKRAVANLIDNAAEALGHALQKEIWVRTSLDPGHDVVEITVADSGPGIAPEDKEKLFLPYFSTKHRGTGLGLAIVSRIVSEQKGIIRVEENQPTGTKFIIELPVERTPAIQEQEGSRQ